MAKIGHCLNCNPVTCTFDERSFSGSMQIDGKMQLNTIKEAIPDMKNVADKSVLQDAWSGAHVPPLGLTGCFSQLVVLIEAICCRMSGVTDLPRSINLLSNWMWQTRLRGFPPVLVLI